MDLFREKSSIVSDLTRKKKNFVSTEFQSKNSEMDKQQNQNGTHEPFVFFHFFFIFFFIQRRCIDYFPLSVYARLAPKCVCVYIVAFDNTNEPQKRFVMYFHVHPCTRIHTRIERNTFTHPLGFCWS